MTLCWAYPVWLGLGWQKLLVCWTHFWASACPSLSSGLTQQTAASLCSIPPLDSGSHKPGQREAENTDMVDRVMSLAGCHCLSFQRCSSLFELENFGLNSTVSDTDIAILSFQQFVCIFFCYCTWYILTTLIPASLSDRFPSYFVNQAKPTLVLSDLNLLKWNTISIRLPFCLWTFFIQVSAFPTKTNWPETQKNL